MYVENIYYCLYRLTPPIIEAPLDVYLLVEKTTIILFTTTYSFWKSASALNTDP